MRGAPTLIDGSALDRVGVRIPAFFRAGREKRKPSDTDH